MKPTRSEIRGTWLLAAVCAVALLVAAVISRCGGGPGDPDAEPLWEMPEVPGNPDAPDSVAVSEKKAAGSSKRGGAAKSPKGRAPRPVPKDTPSPLDRPL